MKTWLVPAIAIVLVAIAIVMRGGDEVGFTGGTELLYSVDGDPVPVAAVLQRRLSAYGAQAEADVSDGRVRVRVAKADDARVAPIKELIALRGGLELRITVEPAARDDYAELWERFGGRGERDAAGGLRWYPLSADATFAAERLPNGKERWVLCEVDDHNITDEALVEIHAELDTSALHESWAVYFRVRRPFQQVMLELTTREEEHLAIIVHGEVQAAPVLRSALTDSGQISGSYSEDEARMLAATLAAGRLAEVPVLHSEQRIT